MSNPNTTATSPDRNAGPTEMEQKAERMGCPRVIWHDPGEYYRIVLAYNGEEDTIDRVFEHCEGHDSLGAKRWSQVPAHTLTGGAAYAPHAAVDRAWYHLACLLMVEAAPWPTPQDSGPGSGTDSPAGPDAHVQARSDRSRPKIGDTQTRVFTLEQIQAAESALLDAYAGVNTAYRLSNQAKVDARLMVAQDALAKLAEALGLDPFREPASEPLSPAQGDA